MVKSNLTACMEYSAPKLIRIDTMENAFGTDCGPGSNAKGLCEQGAVAAGNCLSGSAPTGQCDLGASFN